MSPTENFIVYLTFLWLLLASTVWRVDQAVEKDQNTLWGKIRLLMARLVPKIFHLEICDFLFEYMQETLNVIK